MTKPIDRASSRACIAFVVATVVAGCAEEPPFLPSRVQPVEVGTFDDAGIDDSGVEVEPVSCADAEPGTKCGPFHHCIDGLCRVNRCGDGFVAEAEQCDDGNEISGDECNPACVATPKSCGDGLMNDEREECDDANREDGDACSNGCTINACANGRKDPGEECDDGNGIDDDDCANACTHNRCRNGRKDPGEECDDGNRLNDDGCTNACVIVMCGDEKVYAAFEECDDANTVDDDACSNECTANVCGNNRIDVHEVCDGSALPEGLTGVCNGDCSGSSSLDACEPCRRESNQCTDYQGSGFNLLDGCLTTPPDGAGPDFVEKCAALSTCITQSRCDLVDPEVRIGCFCGVGNTLDDCQSNVMPAFGPCVDEFLDAAGCADQAKPSECTINLAEDLALPVGYAVELARCDREYCLDECRPE